MKKRILSISMLLMLVFSLTACGNKEQTYNGMSADEVQAECESYAGVITNGDSYADADEEMAAIYDELVAEWDEVSPESGAFTQFTDFDIDKSGKTTTATLTMDCEERDAEMVFVFNSNTMELTAINVNLVYTLGETMSKAGLNTVMGITIVFIILILISLIIYCFNIIPIIEKKLAGKGQEEAPAPKAAAPVAVAPQTKDDLELIAVITAAIAAQTGAATDSFVVRSIKRR